MHPPRQRLFPGTRWSLIGAAAGSDAQSLQQLCESYWYPVNAFIRHQGHSEEDAADLTQAFFTFLIETGAVRKADRTRGRFRNFLVASVRHFLSNERDRARALKRGGGVHHIPFESDAQSRLLQPEMLAVSTPDQAFARSLALNLVERALERLRAELTDEGRVEDYERYRWLLCDDPAPGEYEHLAAETGLCRGTLRVAVHRMRERFRTILRQEIERAGGTGSADEEIRFLINSLGH